MRLLLSDNTVFDMNTLPEVIDDLHFCILDYSNVNDVDFYWIPLVFLDVFPRPAADLQIGKHRVQLPLDWAIVIADKDFGCVEILELKDLRDRPLDALILNPITGFMPDFGEINQINMFPDITWYVPKLKYGHILVLPLEPTPNPPCILVVKDIHRLPEVLDITKVFT